MLCGVDDDRHLHLLFLKGFEQISAAVGFRNKDCFADEWGNRLMGHLIGGFVDTVEHILCIDDADDIIDILFIDRDSGITFFDCQMNDVHHSGGVFHGGDIGSMGHDVFSGDIVKFKDVVDHVGLVLFDRAFLVADVNHHADLFLGNLFRFILGINMEELENEVGAGRKNCDERFADGKYQADGWSNCQRDRLGVVHGDTLWHQFTQHEVDIAQYQGDDDQRKRLCCRIGHERGEHLCKRAGKLIGCCSGCQKSREGDTDLDGGEELRGFRHQIEQGRGALVSVLGHLFELVVIEGDDGDLAHGKECVNEDQNQKNEKVNDDTVTVRVHFFLLFRNNGFIFLITDMMVATP